MIALSLFSNDSPTDSPTDDSSPQEEDTISILSDGAKVEGNLEFSSVNLRIEGTVHGDIFTDGRVVVSEGAEVQGTIEAHTIRLAGYIEGRLQAEEELVLCPSSEVHATLRADVLEIQPGADFVGEVTNEARPTEENLESSVPDRDAGFSPPMDPSENGNLEPSGPE